MSGERGWPLHLHKWLPVVTNHQVTITTAILDLTAVWPMFVFRSPSVSQSVHLALTCPKVTNTIGSWLRLIGPVESFSNAGELGAIAPQLRNSPGGCRRHGIRI